MLSIIIPTCNRPEQLSRCLQALAPGVQNMHTAEYEVIVSDDGLEHNAKAVVLPHAHFARHIAAHRQGPAANRNNGAHEAKGEWLIFIDDDCIPDNNLLNAYAAAICAHPGYLAFEGAILPDDWNLLKKDLSECPVNTQGNCCWSANICINKALFLAINGFNESYVIAAQEDQQLKLDIEAATQKGFLFLPECKVVHPVRQVKLKQQIQRIPVQSRNFTLYAYRNSKILQYTNLYRLGYEQIHFHLRQLSAALRSNKPGNALLSLAWLTYGIPLNLLNFRRLQRAANSKMQITMKLKENTHVGA